MREDLTDHPEWVIVTDPGCDDERHALEVFGAGFAVETSGPWEGPTVMDCGCTLTLCRWDDLA